MTTVKTTLFSIFMLTAVAIWYVGFNATSANATDQGGGALMSGYGIVVAAE